VEDERHAEREDEAEQPHVNNGSALNGRPGARPSFDQQGPFRPVGPFQCVVMSQLQELVGSDGKNQTALDATIISVSE
jgi:hypothetical protein